MTALLKKILVVDDDPVIAKSFARVLSAKGYAVITAATGEEALAKLEHEEYDAVFTDIKMPGMSGIEVTKQIKANQPWLPVVIITGVGSDKNQHEAAELGVSEFMHKPLTPEMIERSAELAVSMPRVRMDVEPEVVVPAKQAASESSQFKNIGLFLLAPFIGLFYLLTFPMVGFGILSWMGIKQLWKKPIGRLVIGAIGGPIAGLAFVTIGPIVGLGALAWFGLKAWGRMLA